MCLYTIYIYNYCSRDAKNKFLRYPLNSRKTAHVTRITLLQDLLPSNHTLRINHNNYNHNNNNIL